MKNLPKIVDESLILLIVFASILPPINHQILESLFFKRYARHALIMQKNLLTNRRLLAVVFSLFCLYTVFNALFLNKLPLALKKRFKSIRSIKKPPIK